MRPFVRPAPKGKKRLAWYAPALLWTVSAVGSGSVLFTPRVAAKYEYALVWLALLVCLFMWALIREAARYAIVTGETMLDGFCDLPGPKGWALWVIFLPQLLAAVVGVAGLSALVGSAIAAGAGGDPAPYTFGFLAFSTAVVVLGGYDTVQRLSLLMASVLVALSLAAAVAVGPAPGDVMAGLSPALPQDFELGFALPWIGTILAGSMGIVWFAYWTATHGYGGPTELSAEHKENGENEHERDFDAVAALKRWNGLSTRAAALAVVAGALVIIAFTILGAELLAPKDQVPSGPDVAKELASLFEGVWGRFGFWAMIVLSIFALGGSVIANQDGWGRTFADITILLKLPRPAALNRQRLQKTYVATVTGIAPAIVYAMVKDPVTIMSASGVVGAVHTPFIAGLILLANLRRLPKELRPGPVSVALTALAGLFYLGVSAAQGYVALF